MSMVVGWMIGTVVALIINIWFVPPALVAFLLGVMGAGLGMLGAYAWNQHNEWKRWR